ncbi:MAG TPA: type II toxin-antitoxin system HicB family antitoxin [Candidatus Elarobacter sp.]|nr:type II toxin-antitoxin system HicB family antitoxin [Candidatus Elarobacter sp.]
MPKASAKDEIERILRRPYTYELVRDENGSWFARVLELVGCMTTGSTEAAALASLHDAMKAWVTDALEQGDAVPEPATVERFSGKFMVRVPKSLHRDLSRRADAEGVSLNALVTASLAATMAGRAADGLSPGMSLMPDVTALERRRRSTRKAR